MPKPKPDSTQFDTMNGLFKACSYPTASTTEMVAWNNIDSVGAGASVFYAAGGTASVGLFQYDITCLQNLC
jgi:hypothetical protein